MFHSVINWYLFKGVITWHGLLTCSMRSSFQVPTISRNRYLTVCEGGPWWDLLHCGSFYGPTSALTGIISSQPQPPTTTTTLIWAATFVLIHANTSYCIAEADYMAIWWSVLSDKPSFANFFQIHQPVLERGAIFPGRPNSLSVCFCHRFHQSRNNPERAKRIKRIPHDNLSFCSHFCVLYLLLPNNVRWHWMVERGWLATELQRHYTNTCFA